MQLRNGFSVEFLKICGEFECEFSRIFENKHLSIDLDDDFRIKELAMNATSSLSAHSFTAMLELMWQIK